MGMYTAASTYIFMSLCIIDYWDKLIKIDRNKQICDHEDKSEMKILKVIKKKFDNNNAMVAKSWKGNFYCNTEKQDYTRVVRKVKNVLRIQSVQLLHCTR